jgi:hypothetical protein
MDAHFSEFFVFTIHAHLVAFVVHMAALFEKRQDTINLRRLINEMKATAMLPSKAAAEIDALLGEVRAGSEKSDHPTEQSLCTPECLPQLRRNLRESGCHQGRTTQRN